MMPLVWKRRKREKHFRANCNGYKEALLHCMINSIEGGATERLYDYGSMNISWKGSNYHGDISAALEWRAEGTVHCILNISYVCAKTGEITI